MDRWAGRVAVVTGASEGIGEAIVRRLVARGMKVVALARRKELLQALERDLNAKFPGRCTSYVCDVSDEQQGKESFELIEKNVGAVSVLVNNAAISKFTSIADMDISAVKSTFDINLMGVMYCTQQALASMKAAGVSDGHIININSICGHRDLMITGNSIYTAGKHALTSICTSMKRELAEAKMKTRVTSISPGLVKTSMVEWYTNEHPEVPVLRPDDVAGAVEYALASPEHVNISEVTIEAV